MNKILIIFVFVVCISAPPLYAQQIKVVLARTASSSGSNPRSLYDNQIAVRAFFSCQKLWIRYIREPLKLEYVYTIPRYTGVAKSASEQDKEFWATYWHYPFSTTSIIWIVIAPEPRFRPVPGAKKGIAVIAGYMSRKYKPVIMIWPWRSLSVQDLGAVICHEIAHSLSYRHKYGYEFSPTSIAVIEAYLARKRQRQIRSLRRRLITARQIHNRRLAQRLRTRIKQLQNKNI